MKFPQLKSTDDFRTTMNHKKTQMMTRQDKQSVLHCTAFLSAYYLWTIQHQRCVQ